MSANRCTGILGWIFGHKFVLRTSTSAIETGYCLRCGRKVES